jgi:phosphatidylserine/phosphatidylglycerophosphate/cardiolipin synthase-like enzyme
VIVIDEQAFITGSFNFTKSAEDKNAENLLVIKDKGIAMKYTENWKEHARHSPLHKGRPIQAQIK